MSGSWARICPVGEAVVDKPLGAVVGGSTDGEPVCVVATAGGGYVALPDRCPHRDIALSGGIVKDGTLVCPGHFRRFDLMTGERTDFAGSGVTLYPTRVVDGWVEALLPPAQPRQSLRAWLLSQAQAEAPAMQEHPNHR